MTLRILLAVSLVAACGADAPPVAGSGSASGAASASASGAGSAAAQSVATITAPLSDMIAKAKPSDTFSIAIWIDPAVALTAAQARLRQAGFHITGDLGSVPVLEAIATAGEIRALAQHPEVYQIEFYDSTGVEDAESAS